MENILEGIKSKGFEFLLQSIKDDISFRKLSTLTINKDFEDVVVNAIISAGQEALKVDKLNSHYILHILAMLKDNEHSNRLRTIMKSDLGNRILRESVSNPAGEFLVFGPMSANYPLGHAFVSELLKTREGRTAVIAIVDAACHSKPAGILVLPPFENTPKGKELRQRLQTDKDAENFVVLLKSEVYSEDLANYMAANMAEAENILHETISTKEGVARVARIMLSESGKAFCSLLGKKGIGRKFGSAHLWLTKGGRELVHALLNADDGPYVVYSIATGMSVAEFVAYTLPLERK